MLDPYNTRYSISPQPEKQPTGYQYSQPTNEMSQPLNINPQYAQYAQYQNYQTYGAYGQYQNYNVSKYLLRHIFLPNTNHKANNISSIYKILKCNHLIHISNSNSSSNHNHNKIICNQTVISKLFHANIIIGKLKIYLVHKVVSRPAGVLSYMTSNMLENQLLQCWNLIEAWLITMDRKWESQAQISKHITIILDMEMEDNNDDY